MWKHFVLNHPKIRNQKWASEKTFTHTQSVFHSHTRSNTQTPTHNKTQSQTQNSNL